MSTESIGAARMESDGTIVLQLRAEGPGGVLGDALLRYPTGHPQYHEILQHVGGLEKGQSKPVPPWPEKSSETGENRDAEAGSKQVLVDTFRNLVRYALLTTHRDVQKFGVTPAGFSVAALDESLAARANAGIFGEHIAPSLRTLLKNAHQPSVAFHFYWKAPSAREPLEAAFALSYEADGDLKVRLLWLACPSASPSHGPPRVSAGCGR